MNKISAQTVENFDQIVEVKAKLGGMETKMLTSFKDQNTTLKLIAGVLSVMCILLAFIAWG